MFSISGPLAKDDVVPEGRVAQSNFPPVTRDQCDGRPASLHSEIGGVIVTFDVKEYTAKEFRGKAIDGAQCVSLPS